MEARGDVAGAGAGLLGRWAEPHRAYHDLAHLSEVLERVDLMAAEADRPDAVRLAAWFHDAVYDPTAADNEERSAALAMTTLRLLGVDELLLDEVTRLVRLTATHDVGPDDANGAVLCDADLAVLASDDLRYAAYVEGVRREYAHVDDAAFADGRAQVLSTGCWTGPCCSAPRTAGRPGSSGPARTSPPSWTGCARADRAVPGCVQASNVRRITQRHLAI